MANGFATPESTFTPISLNRKTISPPKQKELRADPRGWRQRKADEFYSSGSPLSSIVASLDDIFPGIPFVDIIPDPPKELTGRKAGDVDPQKLREVLNAIDMMTAAAVLPKAVQKGVGRLATNLIEPIAYDKKIAGMLSQLSPNTDLSSIFNNPKQFLSARDVYYPSKPKDILKESIKAVKKGFKAVKEDKPIYTKDRIDPFINQPYSKAKGQFPDIHADIKLSEVFEGRELPYRKMFGLKPRFGKDVYKSGPEDTYSFNLENKLGKKLAKIVEQSGDIRWDRHGRAAGKAHPVMGNYSIKPATKQRMLTFPYRKAIKEPTSIGQVFKKKAVPLSYEYGDVWNFALNTSAPLTPKRALRWAMDKLTDPVTIKGQTPKRWGELVANPESLFKIEEVLDY